MKKYEFTGEIVKEHEKCTLRRIRAVKNFGAIKAGTLGGWIENEDNLTHDGDAWVYDNAKVWGNARIYKTSHLLTVGPIGSRNDVTTFFRDKNNRIIVKCSCFTGTLEEFRKEVKKYTEIASTPKHTLQRHNWQKCKLKTWIFMEMFGSRMKHKFLTSETTGELNICIPFFRCYSQRRTYNQLKEVL